MAERKLRLVPLLETQVRRMAHIAGECSAAHAALCEHQRREANGESVRFYYDQRSRAIVVGPRPKPYQS